MSGKENMYVITYFYSGRGCRVIWDGDSFEDALEDFLSTFDAIDKNKLTQIKCFDISDNPFEYLEK